MYKAYSKIVERVGLRFKVVDADTGLIGGKSSHEFIVLAGDGEETLVYCPDCGYAANMEMAQGKNLPGRDILEGMMEEVSTPGVTDIEKLAEFLKVKKTADS